MKVNDLFLQLFGLVGSKAEVAEVITAQLNGVVVSQLRLGDVWTQEGVSGKGARQTARHDIISQLKAKVEPDQEKELSWCLNILQLYNYVNIWVSDMSYQVVS